jgi:hypothetical protein
MGHQSDGFEKEDECLALILLSSTMEMFPIVILWVVTQKRPNKRLVWLLCPLGPTLGQNQTHTTIKCLFPEPLDKHNTLPGAFKYHENDTRVADSGRIRFQTGLARREIARLEMCWSLSFISSHRYILSSILPLRNAARQELLQNSWKLLTECFCRCFYACVFSFWFSSCDYLAETSELVLTFPLSQTLVPL